MLTAALAVRYILSPEGSGAWLAPGIGALFVFQIRDPDGEGAKKGQKSSEMGKSALFFIVRKIPKKSVFTRVCEYLQNFDATILELWYDNTLPRGYAVCEGWRGRKGADHKIRTMESACSSFSRCFWVTW